MSKINMVLLGIFIIILGLIAISVFSKKSRINQTSPSIRTTENKQKSLSTQTDDGGNVSIVATAKVLEVGENPVFELAFNTHSEDLSFDVSKVTKLVDDKNISNQSSLWEGSLPGGHHRSGTLTFPFKLNKTRYVDLVIENVAGVKERKLRWSL